MGAYAVTVMKLALSHYLSSFSPSHNLTITANNCLKTIETANEKKLIKCHKETLPGQGPLCCLTTSSNFPSSANFQRRKVKDLPFLSIMIKVMEGSQIWRSEMKEKSKTQILVIFFYYFFSSL